MKRTNEAAKPPGYPLYLPRNPALREQINRLLGEGSYTED